MWRNKFRVVLLAVLGVCGGLAICDSYVAGASSGRVYSNVSDVPARPVALVLGTAKYVQGGWVNMYYTPRIEAAAKLFHAGKVRGIIVSGDNGRTEYDEPTHMKGDLIALGVPHEFITCDYAGFRTLDSVHRIEQVFRQSEYIVVSQEFHVQRALYIARGRGHNAVGLAVQTPGGASGFRVRLREVFARTKAILDVNILKTGPKYLGKFEYVSLKQEDL